MRLFYWLSRKISYTFATSFFTVLFAWFIGGFSYYLSSSFMININQNIIHLLYRVFPISIAAAILIHIVHFGLLTPLKIPAFTMALRRINDSFKSDYAIDRDSLERVYGYLSDLPMYSMLASVLYTAIVGIAVTAYAMHSYFIAEVLTANDMKIIYKMVVLSIGIAMVLYGLASYLLTEATSNKERTLVYNRLLMVGAKIRPRVLIGIRLKLFFFVMLMIITLLTFAALMEKSRYSSEFDIISILVYFIISILAGLFLMQITSNSIVKILKDMSRVSREIASGGRAGFTVLSLEKEFAAIEYAMMEMAWEIDEHRQNLERKVELRTLELQDALTDLKGRDDLIQKQLDMASVIQRSILPGRIDDWNELKFTVKYIAMEKIGGDFYDIIQLKDDKLGIVIADVSGHGIPAALVTTMAKISFGNAGQKFDSPRRIFQEVNQNILDHVKTQDYLTCFMAVIDDEYNLVYSNASHQKAILLRTMSGTTEKLDTDGLFLGAVLEARDTYSENKTKLNYGDRLILYTDGIPESINSARKEFGIKSFDESIIRNRSLPLNDFSNALIDDLQKHIGSAQIIDDITLIVVELARDEAVDIVKNSKNLTNSHKYSEAVEALENGLVKYPDNQKILYNLAKNYFRIGSFEKCLAIIGNYIDSDKRNKYAFYIAGSSCYQLEKFDEAVDFFNKAVGVDANFIYALFALGMAFRKKGSPQEAVKVFERVVNIDPDNKMALYELQLINKGGGQSS